MNLTKAVSSAAAFTMVISGSLPAAQVRQPLAAAPRAPEPCAARPLGAVALDGSTMDRTLGGDDMEAYCAIIGVCTGFFPYGTAFCGPQFLTCLYWYYHR